MKFVTRAEAVTPAAEFKSFEVEELGGFVNIRKLTGAERFELEQARLNAEEKKQVIDLDALLVSKVVFDESRELLFPGEQGIKELNGHPQIVKEKLVLAANLINRISNFDEYYENLKKTLGVVSSSASAES